MDCTEIRTQLEALDVAALENCIANLQARIDTANTMGRAFAGLGCFISRDREILGQTCAVLAEREAEAEALLLSAFEDEGEDAENAEAEAEAADIEAAESARYEAELEAFNSQAELDELNEAYRQMQEDAEAARLERETRLTSAPRSSRAA